MLQIPCSDPSESAHLQDRLAPLQRHLEPHEVGSRMKFGGGGVGGGGLGVDDVFIGPEVPSEGDLGP